MTVPLTGTRDVDSPALVRSESYFPQDSAAAGSLTVVTRAEAFLVDVEVEQARTDAAQALTSSS